MPGAAGLIAGSQLTPILARRFRPAYVLAGGLLLSLPGYAAIALYEGVLTASLGLTVIMFGVAPISVLGTALAVGAAPAEKAGAAAATGQTAYDLGLALGIAITGTLAAAERLPDGASGHGNGLLPGGPIDAVARPAVAQPVRIRPCGLRASQR